jgi:hypothetical protein
MVEWVRILDQCAGEETVCVAVQPAASVTVNVTLQGEGGGGAKEMPVALGVNVNCPWET